MDASAVRCSSGSRTYDSAMDILAKLGLIALVGVAVLTAVAGVGGLL
jgi:hypothetical protein